MRDLVRIDVATKLTAVLARLREQFGGYDPETAHYLLDRWETALGGEIAGLAAAVASVARRRGYQAASAAFGRRWESRNGFIQLDQAMRQRATVSIARWSSVASAYGADIRRFVAARQMVAANDELRQAVTRRRSEIRLRPHSAVEQLVEHRTRMAEANIAEDNPRLERHLVERTHSLLDLGEQIDSRVAAAVEERNALLDRARTEKLSVDTVRLYRLPSIAQQSAMLRALLKESGFQKRKAAQLEVLRKVGSEIERLREALECGATS